MPVMQVSHAEYINKEYIGSPCLRFNNAGGLPHDAFKYSIHIFLWSNLSYRFYTFLYNNFFPPNFHVCVALFTKFVLRMVLSLSFLDKLRCL